MEVKGFETSYFNDCSGIGREGRSWKTEKELDRSRNDPKELTETFG